MAKKWDEYRRKAQSERMKIAYRSYGERAIIAYRKKYPERVAVQEQVKEQIAAGSLIPQPCDRCGGEGRPVHNYHGAGPQVIAWRCFPCRYQETDR